jgi:hypothetical protein
LKNFVLKFSFSYQSRVKIYLWKKNCVYLLTYLLTYYLYSFPNMPRSVAVKIIQMVWSECGVWLFVSTLATYPIRIKTSKRRLLDVFFMSFLTLQCVFFCSTISKKKTPKISELATFSSASSGGLKSFFWVFFTLNYYFFLMWKLKTLKTN